MAEVVGVSVFGTKALLTKLRAFQRRVSGRSKAAINKSALNIQTAAKKRLSVPKEKITEPSPRPQVDTGRLRASIQIGFLFGGIAADIGSNLEYSKFIEFGTGRRGAGSDDAPPTPSDYNYGSVPGMEARPYLFPSFEEEVPKLEKELAARIRRVIRTSAG